MEAVVEIDEGVRGPKAGPEVFARDHLAAVLKKDGEELYRKALKGYAKAALAQLTAADIQLKEAESESLDGGSCGRHACFTGIA
jgi:hypothetical protein